MCVISESGLPSRQQGERRPAALCRAACNTPKSNHYEHTFLLACVNRIILTAWLSHSRALREVLVPVSGGGWSFADGRDQAELRFWLRFGEGAARRDIRLPAGPVCFTAPAYKADDLARAKADFAAARKQMWAAEAVAERAAGFGTRLASQAKLAAAVANKQRLEKAIPLEGDVSENPGDWPGLSSRISIKRGTVTVKRGALGFAFPTVVGAWSAEPVYEGVEAARAKRLYY